MVKDTDLFVVLMWVIAIGGVGYMLYETTRKQGETLCGDHVVIVNGKKEQRDRCE